MSATMVAVFTDDLFREFDDTALEYGWHSLGQPERLTRRYGKRIGGEEVTLRLYANRSGTALVGLSRVRIGAEATRSERWGTQLKGKRDFAIDILRGVA